MASIVNGPDFIKARDVVLNDDEDNAVGSCGVHNAGIMSGLVAIVFDHDPPDESTTLQLEPSQFVFCHVRRVLATGTTIAEADLRILY